MTKSATCRIHNLWEKPEWIPAVANWLPQIEPPHIATPAYCNHLIQQHMGLKIPCALVAALDGEPVASVFLGFGPAPNYGVWIKSLYVKPAHRGLGIGGALLKQVRLHANTLGHIKRIYLMTNTATDFYCKRGWIRKNIVTIGYDRYDLLSAA
ncbi:hypothetical protein MASR1M60_15670 [Rhodocyclaceae bacterium]